MRLSIVINLSKVTQFKHRALESELGSLYLVWNRAGPTQWLPKVLTFTSNWAQVFIFFFSLSAMCCLERGNGLVWWGLSSYMSASPILTLGETVWPQWGELGAPAGCTCLFCYVTDPRKTNKGMVVCRETSGQHHAWGLADSQDLQQFIHFLWLKTCMSFLSTDFTSPVNKLNI